MRSMRVFEREGRVHCFGCNRAFESDPRIVKKEKEEEAVKRHLLDDALRREDSDAVVGELQARWNALHKETEHWTDGCSTGDTYGAA